MKQNKITTYLLYAIGEIILVVIGILIAIQIDGWNDKRKERLREAFLLEQINKEMLKNLEQYQVVQQNINRTVEGGKSLIQMFPLDRKIFTIDSTSSKFSKHFPDFLYNPSFDPSYGTLKSVISSGDLNLIQNEELRLLIVTWEDVFNDYKEEEIIAWEYGYKLMEWMADHFPNPQIVSLEPSKMNYRGLQGRIGEKVSMYAYAVEGSDNLKMKQHMERMVELTNLETEP